MVVSLEMKLAEVRPELVHKRPANMRVELGRLPDLKSPTPFVVTLFVREIPQDPWRVSVNYCYPDPLVALEEARQILGWLRAGGEPVEDNLDQVEIAIPKPGEGVEEVLHGNRATK